MTTTTTLTAEMGLGNASWNESVEQLLLERLGPRSNYTVSGVILTVVYALIFLSGTLGNVCTCVVIARNHCMQTTTNYYLFSLAVSDLLLLFFGLPPELYSIWVAYPWPFGEAFCYIRHTILELTSYASVLTITAFTVERYIAVCKPLLSHKIAVLSRAVKIIVCIWIVSLLVALPYGVHTKLYHTVTWPPTGQPAADSLVCTIPDEWLEGRMTYMFQISTFLFFLAPVTLIICLYILIGVAIKRSPLSRASSEDQCHSHRKHVSLPHQPRRVVIRMLVAVTVAFIICWAPFHTQRLMVLYVHSWTPELLTAQSHIFYISGVLYFVSSTVNPILYNVISRRYRLAFKQTIFGPCTSASSKALGSNRQRQSSNNINTNRQTWGRTKGEQTYVQQRCSLLAQDHPQLDPLRRHKDDVNMRRDVGMASRGRIGHEQRLSRTTSEQRTTSLCPDFLDCRKVKAESGVPTDEKSCPRGDVHVNRCHPDAGHQQGHGVNLAHCEHQSHKPTNRGLGEFPASENLWLSVKTENKPTETPNTQPPTKSHFTTSCDGGYSPGEVQLSHPSGDSDTNYNAYRDKTQEELKEDDHHNGTYASDPARHQGPSSSHQHSVARLPAVTTSLCKECLANSSSAPVAGDAPRSDVHAYNVGFDVNQPHTLV